MGDQGRESSLSRWTAAWDRVGRWRHLLALLVVLVWGWTPSWAGAAESTASSWTVTVEVHVPAELELTDPSAELRWLGEPRALPLTAVPGSDGERVWQGELSGEPLRLLPLRLRGRSGAEEVELYSSVEVLELGDQRLHFAVSGEGRLRAHRVSGGGLLSAVMGRDARWLSLSFLWAVLMVLAVLLLIRRPPSEAEAPRVGVGRWEPLIWLGLAVLWTWPAALAGGDQYVGRHFDAPGTIWFFDAAGRFWSTLVDPHTAWPEGAEYLDADSFVLLGLGTLVRWGDPARWHGWLQVLGVASSAWAASAFARTVGARSPWTLLAGLGFAFSGLAANALLEGHVYHVLNPWMPLFGLLWWRATGEQSTAKIGALAGGAFVLTMLTTGYLGASAALLAVGLFGDGLWRQGRRILPASLSSLAVVLPCGVAYVMLHQAGTDGGTSVSAHQLQLGSLGLSSLAGATPELDRTGHSLAVCLPGLVVALMLYARLGLARQPRWKVLALVAVAAVLLAMGPSWGSLSSPLGWLWTHGPLERVRFPLRLIWVALLCGSVLAAWTATHLFERRPRWGALLLVGALVESFLVVGLPLRQQVRLASSPSVYETSEGAVFELFPTYVTTRSELDNWLTATSCLYQTRHQRPIAEDCVHVPIDPKTDRERSRWVGARLLDGDAEAVVERLRREDFASLAVQPDLYSAGDWARIRDTLLRMDPSPRESRDGGAFVRLYQIPDGSGPVPPVPDPGRSDRMRIQLWSPEPPVGESLFLFARIQSPDGGVVHVGLEDDSGLPGDKVNDGVWSGEVSGPLSSGSELSLLRDHPVTGELVWSGPLRPAAHRDHRVFLRSDDGSIAPLLFGEELGSPAASDRNSQVAAIGSVVWLLLCGLGLVDATRRGARSRPHPRRRPR